MEPFDTLLEVQERDTALGQLAHRRATLSERAALAAIDDEARTVRRSREEVAARHSEVTARESRLEADTASVDKRIHEVEGRLYGGTVSASRELQAMADEAQSLRRRRADLEDQTLVVMEELEPVDAELDALDGQLDALDARATVLLAALAEAEAGLDAEAAGVREIREVAAARLPAELSERYERLRSRLGGIGAAPLGNGSCSGCHLHLPATELDRIRRAPADSVLTCDQCGRILVR